MALVRADAWDAVYQLRFFRADSRPQPHDSQRAGTATLIILNLPIPYAQGNNNPGATIGITVNDTLSGVVAGFTHNEQVPPSPGRVPTTLVLGVPLAVAPQAMVGVWSGVRGSTVVIDTPATLSAILDQNCRTYRPASAGTRPATPPPRLSASARH